MADQNPNVIPEVSNRDILNSLMAIVARMPQPSHGSNVLREIQYLPENDGDSKSLMHFIVMVETHLQNTAGDHRATWNIIQQVKVKGRAMDLLIISGVATWEQAKELFKQHYRPIINSADLTKEISTMKVSSIYDLTDKLEYILSRVNTYVVFCENQEQEKLLYYNIIINKIREVTIGNLAREIRNLYDIHEIKTILYSYIGYDNGNIKINETNRTTSNQNNQYRNPRYNSSNNRERRQSYSSNPSGQRYSGNFRQNDIRHQNYNTGQRPSGNSQNHSTHNRHNRPEPMDTNSIQTNQGVIQQDINSVEPPVF